MGRIFPDVEIMLTILMSELPEGVYPDDRADDPDPDNRSYSSSEIRTIAQMLANAYDNLEEVSNNKFITTLEPSGVAQWEQDLFGQVQDASQSFTQRKQNLLAKIRASGGISLPAIQLVVATILAPTGLTFDIRPWSGQNNGQYPGSWVLEVSTLEYNTWLALQDPIIGETRDLSKTPLDCSLNYAAAGITAQQLADIQTTAYTYEVDIYGNCPTNVLTYLDQQLTELEGAARTHVIINNANPPGVG